MEECRTPTLLEDVEFKFACTTPQNLNPLQNMHNLLVSSTKNPRCYTPTADTFKSPCLSPIDGAQNAVTPLMSHTGAKHLHVQQMPKITNSGNISRTTINTSNNNNNNTKTGTPSPLHVNAMQGAAVGGASNRLNVSNKSDTSIGDAQNSSGDKSMLNRTISIDILLKTVGLEQYADAFDNTTVESFLKMKRHELHKYGLHSPEHCQRVMDLLKDLNK